MPKELQEGAAGLGSAQPCRAGASPDARAAGGVGQSQGRGQREAESPEKHRLGASRASDGSAPGGSWTGFGTCGAATLHFGAGRCLASLLEARAWRHIVGKAAAGVQERSTGCRRNIH